MRKAFVTIAGVVLLASAVTACATRSGGATGAPSTPASADVNGRWNDGGEKPELLFKDDGSVRGDDGCNTVLSDYTVDGDRVKLGSVTSTGRLCIGMPDWLYRSRTMTVDGDTLTVFNAAGEQIGVLTRAAS